MECTIQQLMQQQLRLMELFSERFSTPSPSETKLMTSAESIAWSITEFHYDPMAKSTFCTWFSHFEDLFRVEFKEQADDWKVRLLLRKLGLSEHDRYANYILPKYPREYNFDETLDEDHGVVERETYHRTSSSSFIIISKRNLSNKSAKRSTWFLCHFYVNIHRTPTLKTIKNHIQCICKNRIWH